MVSRPRTRFLYAQATWMSVTAVLLWINDTLTGDLFVIGSFLGLLVITEITSPFGVKPVWRSRLRWLILLGALAVGYILAIQIDTL